MIELNVKLPGQAIEEATAEVASAAGKEIVGALGRLLRSALGRFSAKHEALALEDQRDTAFSREQKRVAKFNEERRQQEEKDIVHNYRCLVLQAAGDQFLDGGGLFALAEDPIDRDELRIAIGHALNEMRLEQRRNDLTSIGGISMAEADPERENARPVDDDWLMNFFKYAREVSEERVRHILARALADVAIKGRPIISPRALDTVRFFEERSFNIFTSVARHLSLFGTVPRNFFVCDSNLKEALGKNLDILIEMGLVRIDKAKFYTVELGDLIFTFSYGASESFEFSVVKLTTIGKELAGLWDSTIRSIYLALEFGPWQFDLWNLQRKLNICDQDVKNVAVSLISDICDTWALDIQVFIRHRDKNERVYRSYRANARDEIRLKINPKHFLLDTHNETLVELMLDEFHHFNINQLPNLPERGQSNDFDADDGQSGHHKVAGEV